MDRRVEHPAASDVAGVRKSSAFRLVAVALVAPFVSLSFISPAFAAEPSTPSTDSENALTDSAEATTAKQSDTLKLAGLEDQFETLSRKLAASVVAISAASDGSDSPELYRADTLSTDRLANEVFNKTSRIIGTGFVIDADGYLLTNHHVVAEAEQLWVTTDDRKVYPAFVISSDPRMDLAVLKIPATRMQPVRFAKTDAKRGQWSIALGNPFGLASNGELCMSVGIVSGVNRSLSRLGQSENRIYNHLIQTTAEINPGNSGGPLFNLDGEVIGINTAVVMSSKQSNGIGFAIPADNDVLGLVRDLKDGREITHGYLGVTVSVPTPAERMAAGLKSDSGARIDAVEPQSPAAIAGLKVGDIVCSMGGAVVRDGDYLVRKIALSDIRDPVILDVKRVDGASPGLVSVRLSTRVQPELAVHSSNQRMRWGGLLIGPAPQQWRSAVSGASGLMVVAVSKSIGNTPAGVTPGAIIKTVAGKPVKSLSDLQQVLNDTPADRCSLEVVEPAIAVTSGGRE